jgi:hypothetical protein
MRAIRGSCHTQHIMSRDLAFIYEHQSLHSVFFFFVPCPRGKGFPTVGSNGTVSMELRNGDCASSIAVSNFQRV